MAAMCSREQVGVTASQYSTDPREAPEDGPDLYAKVVSAFEEVALLTTTESATLDDVLRLVCRRLCELLKSRRSGVHLRRSDGLFRGQVGYCTDRVIDAGVSKLVSSVETDRFTAEIVATASPVIAQDAVGDPRTPRRTMRRWQVSDMLGVPLVVDNDVIGIIYVDDMGARRGYSPRDVQLAQAFAGLCATAVQQRWLYQQLGERAKTIDHRRKILSDSSVVHSRVTRAILDGADADSILRLIADLLGKPVVLYGPTLEVMSWAAPTGLEIKQCPGLRPDHRAFPWVRAGLDALADGDASTMLRASPETRCRRLVARMAVGQECVGYLELCEIGRAFADVDATALEHAALAMSLKVLADQHSAELSRLEREEFFADILYRRQDPAALLARAPKCGIDPDGRHVMLRLEYEDQDGGDVSYESRRLGARGAVAHRLGETSKVVLSASLPHADLVLVDITNGGEVGPRSDFATLVGQAVQEASPRFGLRFAVVSNVARSLDDLPGNAEILREAAALVEIAAVKPQLFFAADLELACLIVRHDGVAGARRYADSILAPLAEHDATSGGSLLKTLVTFVECQGQMRGTAVKLGVHENTVRYRLNRLREVSQIDPHRLESLAQVCVALQFDRLFKVRRAMAADGPAGARSRARDVAAVRPC